MKFEYLSFQQTIFQPYTPSFLLEPDPDLPW